MGVPEKVIVKGIFGAGALLRIKLEQLADKRNGRIEGIRVELTPELAGEALEKALRPVHGELLLWGHEADLRVFLHSLWIVKARPVVLGRIAAQPAYLVVLVEVVELLLRNAALAALEDRLADKELSDDAAHPPDIYFLIVLPEAKEKLWGAVPPRADGGSVSSRAASGVVFGMQPPGQAEISDFKDAFLGKKEVCNLHVPVDDLVFVEVGCALTQLLGEAGDLDDLELGSAIEQAGEVVLHEGEHHVNNAKMMVFVRGIHVDNFAELYDIVVIQSLENFYLADGSNGEALTLVFHEDALESVHAIVEPIPILVDLAKSPLPDLVMNLVAC